MEESALRAWKEHGLSTVQEWNKVSVNR